VVDRFMCREINLLTIAIGVPAREAQGAATIERILSMPEAWPKVGEKARRSMLKGFPYALLYVREEEETLITAVAHLHRDPKRCQDRIESIANNLLP
jgi:hypothetical protein